MGFQSRPWRQGLKVLSRYLALKKAEIMTTLLMINSLVRTTKGYKLPGEAIPLSRQTELFPDNRLDNRLMGVSAALTIQNTESANNAKYFFITCS